MEVYQDIFTSWDDVKSNYCTSTPEPDEVYLAYYSYEDYSGTSIVLYRQGDKYYAVHGGHCSCNGLEDQWEPEEYTKEEFIKTLESHYDNRDTNSNVAQVLAKLKGAQ